MQALLVGDSHGNIAFMQAAIEIGHENGYDVVIQVGDFGWWKTAGPNQFINLCNKRAKELGIPLWVIEGNHDFPGDLKTDQRGYRYWELKDQKDLLLPGLVWLPRNTVVEIDSKRVSFIGGAASVDKGVRVEGVDWWADELLTDKDVQKAQDVGEVDILITHDRYGIPPGFKKYNFGESVQKNLDQQKLRWHQIFEAAQPRIHIHGHMHHKYESMSEEWPGTYTVGLHYESFNALASFDFATEDFDWLEYPWPGQT